MSDIQKMVDFQKVMNQQGEMHRRETVKDVAIVIAMASAMLYAMLDQQISQVEILKLVVTYIALAVVPSIFGRWLIVRESGSNSILFMKCRPMRKLSENMYPLNWCVITMSIAYVVILI